MKKNVFRIICAAIALCVLTLSLGCSKEKEKAKGVNQWDIDPSEYLSGVVYKGLTIPADPSGESSKEDRLWAAIIDGTDEIRYPQDKVEEYADQIRQYYKYAAGDDRDTYEALLEKNGELIDTTAKRMVAKDLIYLLVVRTEKISLSESEKTEHFEKYVEKYVADYGYDTAYVKANMTELIYDSMLYDKTMEYLFSQNTFLEE